MHVLTGKMDNCGDAYEVAGDEVLDIEAANEDVEVLGERHEDAEGQRDVAAPQAEGRLVAHGLLVNVLCTACLHEVNVCHEDGDPGEQTEDRDQVDEVAEDNLGGAGDVHEGEAAESGGEEESSDGDTALVGLGEELGSVSLDGLTVESTAGDVEIGVGSGEDEDQDAHVEDVRELLDASFVDGDDEGRRGGGALVSVLGVVCRDELRAVVGNTHSKKKNGEYVEYNDTPEGELDGARDVATRVLGLTNGDTDELSSEESKDCSDHGGPNGKEAASGACCLVLLECARRFPVFEANSIVTGDTTRGDTDHEDEQSKDDNDLCRRQVEFEFTKESNTKVVDAHNNDQEYSDPHTRIHFAGRKPVLNDQCGCSKLVGCDNNIFEPVSVSSSETKSRVTEASGVGGKTTSSRHPGCHFTERAHNDVYQETDHRVGDEDGGRAGFCERRASSNDQTSTFESVSMLVCTGLYDLFHLPTAPPMAIILI